MIKEDKFTFGVALAIMGYVAYVAISSQNSPHPSTQSKPAISHVWVKADSLAYANDQMQVFADKQMACLSNLWGKESAWDPSAYNTVKSQGKHAGGIPQLLGLNPKTPASQQVDRGLRYIYYKYLTPCKAWKHWQVRGWY